MTKKKTIDKSSQKKSAEMLSLLLSNSYVLYIKTQNFHWNLIDPRFFSLHKMFEEQYEELAEAIDLIAERIRGLEILSPGSMKEFLQLSTLKEGSSKLSGGKMIQELLHDHEEIAKEIRPQIEEMQNLGDEGSADLLIERLRVHEKSAWMLRSTH